MPWISIKDFVNKMNETVMKDPEINKEAMIQYAFVCKSDDREYPEGTIVFGVVDSNVTPEIAKTTLHELTVYPSKATWLN